MARFSSFSTALVSVNRGGYAEMNRMYCRAGTFCLNVAFATFLASTTMNGQSTPSHVITTFAGAAPLGDGGPATAALLNDPSSVVSDTRGNRYIADHWNSRIRKVAPDGIITTFADGVRVFALTLDEADNLFAGAVAVVYRYSPNGIRSVFAGTAGRFGFSGDGGPATAATLTSVTGTGIGPDGSLYLVDGARIRRITRDGVIRTIAGTGEYGDGGDGGPATGAKFSNSPGLAVGADGSVYVADTFNFRVRKITPDGQITTVAGKGFGQPTDGPATASGLGGPKGPAFDRLGNLCFGDQTFGVVLRLSPTGELRRVAGTYTGSDPADGPALNRALKRPRTAFDADGSLLIYDASHRVRRLDVEGNLVTIAGRLRFGGDGGPANAAVLNSPSAVEIDPFGNVFIADTDNYRIRAVSPQGVISTLVGDGILGFSRDGRVTPTSRIGEISKLALNSVRALLFAENLTVRSLSGGVFSTVAGSIFRGDSGDGGNALNAEFTGIRGIATDAAGNLYVADYTNNRIRRVRPDGVITAFAGTGTRGFSGDGGPAMAASLDLTINGSALAVDRSGNLYVCDDGNRRVRKVTPSGFISTEAGNGIAGVPVDGAVAQTSPILSCNGIAFDQSNDMYLLEGHRIFCITGGRIRRISGSGAGPVVDGAFAAATTGFLGSGIRVDANGDIYGAAPLDHKIYKLVLNSPSAFEIRDGDNQTALAGQALPKTLRVQLNGRGGPGVAGATVAFAVASGAATLSAATTQTDATGAAGIRVTLGPNPGPVVITATASGTPLPPLRFNLTATAASGGCGLGVPTVTSVRSLSDFGALSVFAPGSWLEISGTNLARVARTWAGSDFNGPVAPIALEGTQVTIGGQPAFVYYISGNQVNVQAPDDPRIGPVGVAVTTCAGTSAPVMATRTALAHGLLSPASFNIAGRQYLVAQFQDGATYVGREGLIAGVPFAPAKPGDSIVAYGVGFGAVTPGIPAGQIAAGVNAIPNLTIRFGQTLATVTFAGLAPGNIGLYQFNLVVPEVADGDHQIDVRVGDTRLSQSLYLTVRR